MYVVCWYNVSRICVLLKDVVSDQSTSVGKEKEIKDSVVCSAV